MIRNERVLALFTVILLILTACMPSTQLAGEEEPVVLSSETAVFTPHSTSPSPIPVQDSTITPIASPSPSATVTVVATETAVSPPITSPSPISVPITPTIAHSPDGEWRAVMRFSDPVPPDGDDQFPNGKYHVEMVVEQVNGAQSWTAVNEWRGGGLGATYPQPVRWSVNGSFLYFANIPHADGCSPLVNGGDLWQLDLDSGVITEIAPYIGLVMALSPDETQLAVNASYGRGFLIRDLATGEEKPIHLPLRILEYGWTISGMEWSPDGDHLLLIQAINPCGGVRKTAVIRVDMTDLSATTIIEPSERNFTSLEWMGNDDVQLLDESGEILHLDPFFEEPTSMVSPTGLVYHMEDGLWQVSDDEQPVLLSSHSGARLSPNGQRAFYYIDETVVITDLMTGMTTVLDLSDFAQWGCPVWGGNEIILLGTLAEKEESGQSCGHLTAIAYDGSWQTVLDPEHHHMNPAISPDGSTVAHSNGRLVRLDGNIETFDPTAFAGFPFEQVRMGSPAWSPDGTKLAWYIAGNIGENGERKAAVAVFDLENKTAVILHPYENRGRGGWFDAPVWSPDGKWLAFRVESVDSSQWGMWLSAADGTEEHYIGGGSPVWNEDGTQLAYYDWDGRDTTVFIVETDSWIVQPTNLPLKAIPVGWLSSP